MSKNDLRMLEVVPRSICDRIWERNLIAQIMIFLYRRFSATAPKNNSRDCLSQRYLPLFAYTHAKFERVEVFLKGQARCLKTAT